MSSYSEKAFPDLPWVPQPEQQANMSESLLWTQEFAGHCLRSADVEKIAQRCKELISNSSLHFDNLDELLDSCISALLVGNLVLQGPPGTGKTTLARILSSAFDTIAYETTATSEWSTYDVVGGLAPNVSGGLEPAHGAYTRAAIACADVVRTETSTQHDHQAVWLLIDEFNRADIDKAIGSLYTLLSSTDPDHLSKTPLELWFERDPDARRLWVPARFRIIGTMNDLDTNYVNSISQGLKRRFSFVTIPAAAPDQSPAGAVGPEVALAYDQAIEWYDRCYVTGKGPTSVIGFAGEATEHAQVMQLQVQNVVAKLRRGSSEVRGWPVGSAQVVDVMKYLVLGGTEKDMSARLDAAVAERLVAQFENLSEVQLDAFLKILEDSGLPKSVRALQHIYNPYAL